MNKEALVGIDVGTSGVKVLILDTCGAILTSVVESYPLYTPQAGWTEQEPADWWEATCRATRKAVAACPDVRPASVEGPAHIAAPVRRPHEALGAEQQLLPAAAKSHAGLGSQGDHDVGEGVLEVDRIDVAVGIAPYEFPVRQKRALPLDEYAEVGGNVQVRAQPEPRQKVPVGLFGRARGPK